MSLHYLEKQEPRKLHLFTKTLHTALQPNTKHIKIITWSSLNHPSLLVAYVSNSVNVSCCQTRRGCDFFFQQHSAWCTQHSSADAVQNSQLSPKLWPHQAKAELKWLHCEICWDLLIYKRLVFYCSMGSLPEIKMDWKGATFAFLYFTRQCTYISWVRWEIKLPFNSCRKLSKSVDIRRS